MKIACLGMGKMGVGVAGNLARSGHDVSVWNRTLEACAPAVEAGAIATSSPADAAGGADAVISIISDDAASDRVWLAEDGALAVMKPGAFAIECSTISHGQCAKLASEAASRGLRYVDAPMNGGPPLAASGDMILLVGAAQADLADIRPLLETMSAQILHFGEVGTGTAFKLINNLLGAVHISALAEAVALAERLSLDKETLIAAIESGPCASPHVTRLARAMVEDRLADQLALTIGLREKDSRYCLAMAKSAGQGMTVGENAYRWYQSSAVTHGHLDDCKLIEPVKAARGRNAQT
ncbi:MAG: NAD(P)-dependent oxidoreductase [Pseudomonadota bacterium]